MELLRIHNLTQKVNPPIEYSDKPVTPFGGMALMKRFVDRVGIREYLAELDLPQPGSNRGYTSGEILESFWLNVFAEEKAPLDELSATKNRRPLPSIRAFYRIIRVNKFGF